MRTIQGNLSDQHLKDWLKIAFSQEATSFRTLLSYLYENDISWVELGKMAGKRILLIGGGVSPIKRNLHDFGIRGTTIDNLDPYCLENSESYDNIIRQDFFDFRATDKYDVILAQYSFPLYCQTNYEMLTFYPRAIEMLKPGGTLYVSGIDSEKVNVGLAKEPDNNLVQTFFEEFNVQFKDIKIGHSYRYELDDAYAPEASSILNLVKKDISTDIFKYFQVNQMMMGKYSANASRLKHLKFTAPTGKKSEMNKWLADYTANTAREEVLFDEEKMADCIDMFLAVRWALAMAHGRVDAAQFRASKPAILQSYRATFPEKKMTPPAMIDFINSRSKIH